MEIMTEPVDVKDKLEEELKGFKTYKEWPVGLIFRPRCGEFTPETNEECFNMGLLKLAADGIKR